MTPAMPPCAQLVLLSVRSFLVTSATLPCCETRSANDSPALPLPRTRKSYVCIIAFHSKVSGNQ